MTVTGAELCTVCGAELHGKRRDAGTCSGRCRQKAYRARVAAERAAARGFADQFPGLAAVVPQERSRRGAGRKRT